MICASQFTEYKQPTLHTWLANHTGPVRSVPERTSVGWLRSPVSQQSILLWRFLRMYPTYIHSTTTIRMIDISFCTEFKQGPCRYSSSWSSCAGHSRLSHDNIVMFFGGHHLGRHRGTGSVVAYELNPESQGTHPKLFPIRDHNISEFKKYQRHSNGTTSGQMVWPVTPIPRIQDPKHSQAIHGQVYKREMITQTHAFNPHLLAVIANSGFFLNGNIIPCSIHSQTVATGSQTLHTNDNPKPVIASKVWV